MVLQSVRKSSIHGYRLYDTIGGPSDSAYVVYTSYVLILNTQQTRYSSTGHGQPSMGTSMGTSKPAKGCNLHGSRGNER